FVAGLRCASAGSYSLRFGNRFCGGPAAHGEAGRRRPESTEGRPSLRRRPPLCFGRLLLAPLRQSVLRRPRRPPASRTPPPPHAHRSAATVLVAAPRLASAGSSPPRFATGSAGGRGAPAEPGPRPPSQPKAGRVFVAVLRCASAGSYSLPFGNRFCGGPAAH